ncbi:MAG: nicotinate phosphoribosyltransferase [Janthinobacterium lividum]
MFPIFPPHATDFYKTGHAAQYPDKTSLVYSNFTCRSDRLADVLEDFDHKVVFFGLQGIVQYLLRDAWNEQFFQKPREKVVAKYKRRMDKALGRGKVNPKQIAALHDLGYLPVLIKALPEGSRVDIKVPPFTIQNTHPDFYWATNYLETQISAEIWKPITSATTAYEYFRMLARFFEETGADLTLLPAFGHDFAARGMSGIHDATTSGAAHLTSFEGTDTISAIDYLEDYYPDATDPHIGGSVPATEHAVMCMGGETDEIGTIRRLVTQVYPSGIVSVVSDTWDFWQVVTEYATILRDEIMARRPDEDGLPGKTVFRPDSGDPVKILAGDPDAEPGSPAFKGAVKCLWDVFGGTVTAKGYKVLDTHVGLIYGDSITLKIALRILQALKAKGFAACNVVFGIGSFTYQHVTRDSFGSAVKATFGVVDGRDRVLFKAPKTDSGTKNSARGLLRVEFEEDRFVLHEMQTREQEKQGLLEPVFKDSQVLRMQGISDIRQRIRSSHALRLAA